jgi:hypothetical protein
VFVDHRAPTVSAEVFASTEAVKEDCSKMKKAARASIGLINQPHFSTEVNHRADSVFYEETSLAEEISKPRPTLIIQSLQF